MERFLIFVFMLFCFFAAAQNTRIVVNKLEVKDTFKLRNVKVSSISADATMAGASDLVLPTQKAVKDYIASVVATGKITLRASKPSPLTTFITDAVVDTLGVDSMWIWNASIYRLLQTGGGSSVTNLAYVDDSVTGTISNSNGTAVVIPEATDLIAGLLSATKKLQYDAKNAGVQFKDEGSNLGAQGTVTTVDFTGSGVNASRSGNTITVNIPGGGSGATAAKDTLYFLGSGQSGILGATSAYDGDTASCTCVEIWNEYNPGWRRARIGQDPFRTTAHPRSDATYANSNNLMLHFGKAVSAMTGAHVRLILVQEDGNNITGAGAITRWVNPTNRPMWTRINARIDSARAADPGFKELAGFLWHQGEADAVLSPTTYQTRFDSLKLLLRGQTWFPTYTPIVVGGLRSGNTTYPQDTASLRKMDWNSDPWVGYAYADGLTGNGIDVTHFGGTALVELGKRYFGVWRLLPKRYTELNKDLIDDIAQANGNVGNVQLANSGAFTSDNALNYDASTDRLRINKTTSASANLDLVGTIVATNTPTVTTGTQGILVTSSPAYNTSSASYSAQNIVSTVSTTSGTGNTFESLTLTPTYSAGYAGAGNILALRASNNSDALTTYNGILLTMSDNPTISLSNRNMITATYSKGQNSDFHSVTGSLIQFQDNSASGRINNATGMQHNIVNARTSTGFTLSTTNQRGTGNTQTGINLGFTSSGASTTTGTVTGITMSQSDNSSAVTTNFYGLTHSGISATNRFFLYNTSLTFPSLHTGQFRINNSVTTARLSTKSDAGDTYSLLAQSSAGVNIFGVRENGDVDLKTVKLLSGAGSPEGVVTAPVGSFYTRTDASAGTAGYLKESGTGNIGWSAIRTNGNILSGSATLDFLDTAAGAVSDLTLTITGATDGDRVIVGVPNASMTATGTFFGWVSATNTVTIRFRPGVLTGTENPNSGTFTVNVLK